VSDQGFIGDTEALYKEFSAGGSRGKLVLDRRRRAVVSCEEKYLVARFYE
jgi:hypothetical protein